jgi:hypothetical protein
MSNNSQGLEVTIFPTHVRVPNGMGSFKTISLHDFYQEIGRVAAGANPDSQPKQSFRLPNEAVSVRYNKNELDVLMYFPEEKREVRYGSSTYTIPFPNTVILVSLKSNGKNGWTVERVKWLCTDYTMDEVPNIADWNFTPAQWSNHLWVLPFPNQYGDGGMCVGRNSYRSLYTHDLRGLNELFHHILIASPFNDDLWHRGVSGLRYDGSSPRGWFKILSDLETFPYNRLGGYPQQPTAEETADDENYALEEDEDGED